MQHYYMISAAIVWAYAFTCVSAVFYSLDYSLPAGEHFISLSGNMVVPKHPEPPGVYYLWPGLQPSGSGVYQNVLDGRGPTWWMGSGYCCNHPVIPWGKGFDVFKGETVKFSNVKHSSFWKSTLRRDNPEVAVTNDFALNNVTFVYAIFAIEFYGNVTWNFGKLEFNDITIQATGKSSSWCLNGPNVADLGLNYHIGGVTASEWGGVTTCSIRSLILESPKSPTPRRRLGVDQT